MTTKFVYRIRNCLPIDQDSIYKLCGTGIRDTLYADTLAIGAYLGHSIEYCFLIENCETQRVCGFLVATPDIKTFYDYCVCSWIPSMCDKYPIPDQYCTDILDYEVCLQKSPAICAFFY